MLRITIPARECWDDAKQEFVNEKEQVLQLEHSLVSLSKWESKWCKSLIATEKMTYEETIDYIKCMTLTQNVHPDVYKRLTDEHIEMVEKYMDAPMTATTFADDRKKGGRTEIITNEIIYYWMITLNIPPEYQKWHLNRLLTLIKVCTIKNNPPKKMSAGEIMSRNRALNEARRKQLNTKG